MKAFLAILLLCLPGALLAADAPPAGPSLKKLLTATPLDSVNIPTYTVDQVTLADAIFLLTQKVKKSTNDRIQLQWIYKEVDPQNTPATIVLNGKNRTAAEILSEITTQAKVEVKLEEHAIMISPSAAAKSPATPADGKGDKPAPGAPGKQSSLVTPALETSPVESSAIDDGYDKTPVKGRNPVKK